MLERLSGHLGLVVPRAWQDMRETIGKQTLLPGLAVGLIATAVSWAQKGNLQVSALVPAVIAVGIWIALVFVYHVVVAPLNIVHEREAAWNDERGALLSERSSLQSRVAEVEARPKPKLAFVGTDIDNNARVMIHSQSGTRPVNAPMSWARVLVANDPGDEIGAPAESVVSTVAFYDETGQNLLFELEGRWAEAPQAPELTRIGLSKEGRELDMEANADKHPVDVAMKYIGDDDCYAWNNENGREAVDGRLDRHGLSGDTIRVRVSLRGGNTSPLRSWFTLTNPGKGHVLVLSEWPGP
jgi:hypothetical protein